MGSLEAGWEPTLKAKRAMKKDWDDEFEESLADCRIHLLTDHTVLLIDKFELQEAIFVMFLCCFTEHQTVRQLQCERSDETLVFVSFGDSEGHRSREVCGYGEHWKEKTVQVVQ